VTNTSKICDQWRRRWEHEMPKWAAQSSARNRMSVTTLLLYYYHHKAYIHLDPSNHPQHTFRPDHKKTTIFFVCMSVTLLSIVFINRPVAASRPLSIIAVFYIGLLHTLANNSLTHATQSLDSHSHSLRCWTLLSHITHSSDRNIILYLVHSAVLPLFDSALTPSKTLLSSLTHSLTTSLNDHLHSLHLIQ
jgi:hypothetical protein